MGLEAFFTGETPGSNLSEPPGQHTCSALIVGSAIPIRVSVVDESGIGTHEFGNNFNTLAACVGDTRVVVTHGSREPCVLDPIGRPE